MEAFLTYLINFISKSNSFVWWQWFLIPLLCGTGMCFTVRLHGEQCIRFDADWERLLGNFSLKGEEAVKEGMSSFQAVATTIAAQVGTGNLVDAMIDLVDGCPVYNFLDVACSCLCK